MPRFKLIVAYDGTRFHGFQRQLTNQDVMVTPTKLSDRPPKRPHWLASGQKKPCHATIQQVIEDAISSWTNNNLTVMDIVLLFASRTDKGVHARGQVIAVTLPDAESHQIVNAINSRLPLDISIVSAERCNDESFDPRLRVRLKQYSYTVKFRRRVLDDQGNLLPICQVGPNAFRHALDSPCLWVVPWCLDDSQLGNLCQCLQGERDFSAFVHKDDRKARSHILTLETMTFEIISVSSEKAPVVVGRFVVESMGFRRSMVRNLVGFCVDVCRGCDDLVGFDLANLWTETEDAANKIRSAPASGLCLEFVKYEEDTKE